jgi:hypothetical protein
MFNPKIIGFYLLLASLFFSCEKSEFDVSKIGEDFCPINFFYYSEILFTSGCNPQNLPDQTATFESGDGFVTMNQNLFRYNRPFIGGKRDYDNPYLAAYLSSEQSEFKVEFDKLEMAIGTRISFYMGATNKAAPDFFYMGDPSRNIDRSPSLQHAWQIFVQREIDSTYTLSYLADSVLTTVKTGIQDFSRANFSIKNTDTKCIMEGSLSSVSDISVKVADFETSALNFPKMPSNLFNAIGLNILESLQSNCDLRPVRIQFNSYTYRNNTTTENLQDNFDCNSIILRF